MAMPVVVTAVGDDMDLGAEEGAELVVDGRGLSVPGNED
jgi:hypothetical protein